MIRYLVLLLLLCSPALAQTSPGVGAANNVYATPNGSAGLGSWRSMVGADLPNPGASSLGGVKSLVCGAHQWLNSIDTSGNLNCAQPAFTDISGTAAIAQGGTGAGTAAAAITALMPTPTRTGDVALWNGSIWTTLAGNNSGTQFFSENASGIAAWVTPVGTGTVLQVNSGQSCIGGPITSTGTINCPTGNSNKLRNSSLTSWFHGSGSLTITTAGGTCLEGIFVVPTGASVTCARNTNGLSSPLTFYSQLITGATSVTDVTVRFVIESYDAAPLAGQQVTCQFPILNNTGGSITPTITVKRANTQDATYTNVDVSAVSLQTVSNGSTGTLAYSWLANASSFNGLSVDIDFGNNFTTNGKSIQLGGGFDCHVTPGIATGTVSSPPSPEIRDTTADQNWNKRFFETSYDNGTAPGTVATNGQLIEENADATDNLGVITFRFAVTKRATPTMLAYSSATGASTVCRDGNAGADVAAGFAFVGVNGTSVSSIIMPVARYFCHFTADATLTGG